MSAITITQFHDIGGHRLNVTLRNNEGIEPEKLTGCVADTIAGWLAVAKVIKSGDRAFEIQTSFAHVEHKYFGEAALQREDGADALVTVWDAGNDETRLGLTVHSNSSLRNALVNWWAYQDGIAAARAKFPAEAAKQSQTAPQDRTHTKPPENAQTPHSGVIYANSKNALEQAEGSEVTIRILKIKLSQQDDKSYYGLYGKYGHNVSQHPDVCVYLDNERAQESGLLNSLDSIGLKVGQPIEGEWYAHCRIYTNKNGKRVLDVQAVAEAQHA